MYTFNLLKKIYLIILLLAGFYFSAEAQAKQVPDGGLPVKYLKYYPNPASSNINFEFLGKYETTYTISIFNFIGRKIYESKNIPSRLNVELTDFFRGVYVYQLRNRNGEIVESGKFQVVK